MNNILNKIAQMERNAAEIQGVELAKHEVELALIYQELASLLTILKCRRLLDYRWHFNFQFYDIKY